MTNPMDKTDTLQDWKIFKTDRKDLLPALRQRLKAEGYEEWRGSTNHEDVPPEIWKQYMLENIAGRKEIRILGFKATPTPQVPVANLEALEVAIVKEIENPTVKSEISTSDIRVMGISTTGMEDRMFTIMKLIRVALAQATERAKVEGRITESEEPRNMQLNVNHSYDYKQGFNAAVRQVADGNALRIAHLKQRLRTLSKADKEKLDARN